MGHPPQKKNRWTKSCTSCEISWFLWSHLSQAGCAHIFSSTIVHSAPNSWKSWAIFAAKFRFDHALGLNLKLTGLTDIGHAALHAIWLGRIRPSLAVLKLGKATKWMRMARLPAKCHDSKDNWRQEEKWKKNKHKNICETPEDLTK